MEYTDKQLQDEDFLVETFGEIIEAELMGYWKYDFTIEVVTSLGYKLKLTTGGRSEDIYKYDPTGGWEEHLYAGIEFLEVLTSPEKQE